MSKNQQEMMLNRLKSVLAEQGKTNRWLSEQIGKSEKPFPDGVPIKCNHPLHN